MHFGNWSRTACAALFSAVLSGSAAFAAPAAPVVEAHQKIREIETAIVKGTVDPLRIQLQEQARNRPGEYSWPRDA